MAATGRFLLVFITCFHLNSTEQNAPTFVKNFHLHSSLKFIKTNLNMWCYQTVKMLYLVLPFHPPKYQSHSHGKSRFQSQYFEQLLCLGNRYHRQTE